MIRNDPKSGFILNKFTESLIVILPQDNDIPVAWKMPAYMEYAMRGLDEADHYVTLTHVYNVTN